MERMNATHIKFIHMSYKEVYDGQRLLVKAMAALEEEVEGEWMEGGRVGGPDTVSASSHDRL